jgi:hypothetical protein
MGETGIVKGSLSRGMLSSWVKSRSMKEDDAQESIRAEVVLPLISSLISKKVACGGRAAHEDDEAEMAPVELGLGIVLAEGSGAGWVSSGLESLSAEHGNLEMF